MVSCGKGSSLLQITPVRHDYSRTRILLHQDLYKYHKLHALCQLVQRFEFYSGCICLSKGVLVYQLRKLKIELNTTVCVLCKGDPFCKNRPINNSDMAKAYAIRIYHLSFTFEQSFRAFGRVHGFYEQL